MSTAGDDSVPDGTARNTGAPLEAAASDGQIATRQEHEIEVIRDHLGDLLNELGVRRDEGAHRTSFDVFPFLFCC